MARFTVIFLSIAIVAGIFGYGDVESSAAEIAKYIFFIFVVLFLFSLLSIEFRKR